MVSLFLFILSAVVIVTMLLAKRMEERKKADVFLLKMVSKGDVTARVLHHKGLHYYSIGKDKIYFWVRKQLPLRAKNWLNKSISWAQETLNKYMGDMRNSRLLKRSDGISEFFKNISDVEKGNGEINEIYEERESVVISYEVSKPATVAQTPKKKSLPRKRKITVVEAE